jgi:hypothetical protein
MTKRYHPVTTRARTIYTNARASARKAARKKGILFDLPCSTELPPIPMACPLCDRPMTPGGDSRNDSPSLDRILPQLGYVLENVWWICHDCNRQKADLDPSRAYDMWDRVWEEIKSRGLPVPSTKNRRRK